MSMKTAQHTPGPWHTGEGDCSDQVLYADDELICETGGNHANARLIAAAPEMAEMLALLHTAAHRYADGLDGSPTYLLKITERARALLARLDGGK